MIGEDWVEKLKQYRLAVYAYCDAIDRIDSTGDVGQEWQNIEIARDETERARTALMRQGMNLLSARTRSLLFEEVSDDSVEELVLGDVGQLGG